MREMPYNFGALSPLPDGYAVKWYECHEHYQATGPNDWDGDISVDPYWCRRQAILHSQTAAEREASERSATNGRN